MLFVNDFPNTILSELSYFFSLSLSLSFIKKKGGGWVSSTELLIHLLFKILKKRGYLYFHDLQIRTWVLLVASPVW